MKKKKTQEPQNYRLYCLTNMYISSLQKGLQTAHVVSELSCQNHKVYRAWAEQDRTIIILNGGNSAGLEAFERFLTTHCKKWPWAAFREDKQSLNGAITAVGVIVPEHVYTGDFNYNFDSPGDMELYERLQGYHLAV